MHTSIRNLHSKYHQEADVLVEVRSPHPTHQSTQTRVREKSNISQDVSSNSNLFIHLRLLLHRHLHLLDPVPLLRHTHLMRKCRVWHPLGRRAWRGLLKHAVDLLQRQAFGLGHEDVRVDEAAHAERAPEEEDAGAKVCFVGADEVGGDDGDDLLCMR